MAVPMHDSLNRSEALRIALWVGSLLATTMITATVTAPQRA
jgi:hypothetical protein